MSNNNNNPFIKKNAICNRVCYDSLNGPSFPKFEDVTCEDDNSCYCVGEDKYQTDCFTETVNNSTYTEKTVNDKSSYVENKKSCCQSCDVDPCDPCEQICEATRNKLVQKYECARPELLAYSDIIVMLKFLKNKFEYSQPLLDKRNMEAYTEKENVSFMECFADTVFSVVEKNQLYKVISVNICKVKNGSARTCSVVDREYIVTVKYNTKCERVCVTIPLLFRWTQLTNNQSKSYKGVLNYVVRQLDAEISKFEALGTTPFFCCDGV